MQTQGVLVPMLMYRLVLSCVEIYHAEFDIKQDVWKLVVSREAGGHCGIHEGGGYASSAVRADRDGDMIPVDSSSWRLQCLCMRHIRSTCVSVYV